MQILHMVLHALSRMCVVGRVQSFYCDREWRQRSLCESRVICDICVSCTLLMRTFEAWETAQWLCANGSWSLTLLRISSLKLCFYRFQPFFFLEKYKGIIIFSTVVIVQLYAVQLNPIYKYCVCTLYITLYTLKNETLMLFCGFSLDQKDVLIECNFEGPERWFFANVAEVFTVFMWKMFMWTEWKKHSSGPYGRNWTQSAVGLTATWASFAWAPTL